MMSSPEAQREGKLNEWMLFARQNRRVHDEDARFFWKWADGSMILLIILGSINSLLNIVLGAIQPAYLVIVNIS